MMIWEIIWNKEASRVFTEELTMIKDAEDKADRMKDAKSEAGNIVDAANTKPAAFWRKQKKKPGNQRTVPCRGRNLHRSNKFQALKSSGRNGEKPVRSKTEL